VAEQLIADVAHHSLADVRHEVAGEVRAQPLGEIDRHHRQAPGPQIDRHAPERERRELVRQHTVGQGLDERGQSGGRGGIEQHGRDRRDQAPAIRAGVAEKPG